jgi:energy-coupling factor transport system ATP-binding protein
MSIELNDVAFSYPPDIQVLHNVRCRVAEGEFVLIAGRNGVGKSTLLKLLNGILKPTRGRIVIYGFNTSSTPTATLAKSISVTFQNPADQIFASSVRQEIAFGAENLGRAGVSQIVESTLDLFGLKQYGDRHPYDLLPAQRKLLTIASAVAMGTAALAFDEPTAGLSQQERRILQKVLRILTTERRTLLIASHDLDFFLPLNPRIILMRQGEVAFDGHSSSLIEDDTVLRRCGMRLPTPMRLKRILGTVAP